MKKRTLVIILTLAGCLILAGSISGTGRHWMKGVASLFKSSEPKPIAMAGTPLVRPANDVESLARAQQGWSEHIADSIMRGKIAYYGDSGNQTSERWVSFYRLYPDSLKVELHWETATEVYGVDQIGAWIEGAAVVSEDDMRDICGFIRIWPERLFVARNLGAPYQEIGRHIEDFKPGEPGGPSLEIEPAITFDQVQVEDTIDMQSPQMRIIYYYINHSDSRIGALRYMEPEDPNGDPTDPTTDAIEVRVDFDDWRVVDNVWWPFVITHRLGGKVDFRIWISEVLINQGMERNNFQRP
jgi:hypothetical protein